MRAMEWDRRRELPPLLAEHTAWEGVRRIAGKVAKDMEKVTGRTAKVITEDELEGHARVILCATLGKSALLDELARRGLVDLRPGWETYQIRLLSREQFAAADGGSAEPLCGTGAAGPRGSAEADGSRGGVGAADPCAAVDAAASRAADAAFEWPRELEQILLICGSDKRGTIYGMFSLSEYIGVTPLCFFGDAAPQKRESVTIGPDIEMVSKEPSVRYRGFFINDEWPCFGNWATEHFGGFNAACYDTVFEFLLRMKGNYLWPAMWSASFPLDGPGSANEELADLYGVVMGYSHHEPCLRASEEWKKVCGPESPYGDAWNFYTNEKGLTRYWEDALKRSGKYDNMITIGMRGEYDSCMLGPDATVTENVELLKRIITVQRELIRRHVKRESGEPPLLLALYKEVEAYFYGDEKTPGLKDWDGLEGVTCMLCEDNYGQMRTLPTEEIRNRKGGFGMYYHLDYHGAPVSYEWVDSTPLARIWEQMGQAYEYGIRDVWIVNVGDVKFHEVPLTYFMALAWDFDKWGSGNPDSAREYTALWAQRCFPAADGALRERIAGVFTDYIDINALRRPEALHAGVYHPCHYGETDRMLARAADVERRSEENLRALLALSGQADPQSELTGVADIRPDTPAGAYYSMIHYPAMASMNLLKMHLYAGKDQHYAAQGRTVANAYAELSEACIRRDRAFAAEWAAFGNGKWNGMQLASHIGFTKWNEDDCRYPVLMRVEPVSRPRMSVSRADEERTATKNYGAPMTVAVPDFQYAGCDSVCLEIANTGNGVISYEIRSEDGGQLPPWLLIAREKADAAWDGAEEAAADGTKASAENGTKAEGTAMREGAETSLEFFRTLPAAGRTTLLERIRLICVPEALPAEPQKVRLLISDGETLAAADIWGKAPAGDLPPQTFLEKNGVIAMNAARFCEKKDMERGGFRILKGYGKYGSAVKVAPSTAAFSEREEKPELTWRFYLEKSGEYRVDLIAAPTNPTEHGSPIRLAVRMRGRGTPKERTLTLVPADFRAGEPGDPRWAVGVLDQERRVGFSDFFEAGQWELTVGALEAGAVLERIVIGRDGACQSAYLGPAESECTGTGKTPA